MSIYNADAHYEAMYQAYLDEDEAAFEWLEENIGDICQNAYRIDVSFGRPYLDDLMSGISKLCHIDIIHFGGELSFKILYDLNDSIQHGTFNVVGRKFDGSYLKLYGVNCQKFSIIPYIEDRIGESLEG